MFSESRPLKQREATGQTVTVTQIQKSACPIKMNDFSGLVTVVACIYEHPFKIGVNASRRADGMREEFSWKMV